MPVVPRYDQPQVKQQGIGNIYQTPNAPEEAFGGGASAQRPYQAAERVGDTFGHIVQQEKTKADQVAVLEATQKLSSYETEILRHPENGALNKRGKDALGVVEPTLENFDKKAREISDGLSNDDQRLAFRGHAGDHRLDVDKLLQTHVSSEKYKHDDEVTNSAITNEQNDAAVNYQDSDRVAKSVAKQQAILTDFAWRNGLSGDWVKAKTADNVSHTHFAVIDRMLANGDDLHAQDYYGVVKDQITDAKDVVAVDKALKEGSTRGESQRQSSAIIGKYGEDMKGALAAARAIKDPKVQEATVEQVKTRIMEIEHGKEISQKNLFQTAANTIEKTTERPDPTTWSNLSLTERNALDARIKQLKEGIEPAPNGATFYKLRLQAADPATQKEFLKINPTALRSEMTHTEVAHLIELQAGILKGDEKTAKLLDGYRTDAQIVNDTLAAAGYDPTPKEGKQVAKDVELFRRRVEEEMRVSQAHTGKKAQGDEVQKIADRLMMQMRIPGMLWDSKKKLFELTPDEAAKAQITIKDIPEADQQGIKRALVKRHLPATDEDVIKLYVKGQAR